MLDLHKTDFESGVLSILMKEPDLIFKIPDLKYFMFSSEPNKIIYRSMVEMLDASKMPPQYNLLISYMKANGTLGGLDGYLEYLYDMDFSNEYLEESVSWIINAYKSRKLYEIKETIPKIMTNVSDVDLVISQVRDNLDKISLQSSSGSVQSLLEASQLAWDELVNRVESPVKIECTTGLGHLNSLTGGYIGGETWIIASRPSMGKSAFMCNSVLAGAKEGVKSLIFSLEMRRTALIYRMLSMETGVESTNIRLGILTKKELDAVGEALSEIKNLPIYIDGSFSGSLSYTISTIRKYHKLKGINVVHIDYIQLLAERGDDATHELGRISRELRLLANELNICIIMYSQLNRSCEMRPDKRPLLSDIRQSGNLEEDADIVMFLYRDEMYDRNTKDKGIMEKLIRKHRNGPIGTIFSTFEDGTNLIKEKTYGK